nr:hypothetical protein [Tanacetum cinerariifolium]
MVEGDKVKSESNEEPHLRKKKLDALSFVDVQKLKGDMLVIKEQKRQVSVQKGKHKINEGSLESFKEGKKDKDEIVLMVVENGKEVVLNEKVKCDPVNILTRMSPSHLKNVLDSLTTKQVSVLEELGLDEYHNNFNFTSTPGALGIWIVKNYDYDEHTIKMVDEIGSMSREEELKQFKSKTVQELNHRDDVNAMVVLDNGNDVPEESVKDNEVVDQDVDKPVDVKKENKFRNNELVNDELVSVNKECENDNDSRKKEVEKNNEDLIKGTVVCFEISQKEVSKGVLDINEDSLKDSQSETSIFDSQPEDSQPEA